MFLAPYEALAIPAEWFQPADRRRTVVVMATPEPYQRCPRLDYLPTEQCLIKQALDPVAGVDVEYLPEYGAGVGKGKYQAGDDN